MSSLRMVWMSIPLFSTNRGALELSRSSSGGFAKMPANFLS